LKNAPIPAFTWDTFRAFPGAHSQAPTLDELNRNLREVLEIFLEEGEPQSEAEFELDDAKELDAAIGRNGEKPLIPWADAKNQIEL
jgi:predicted RNase H-like HicB family nuclease